jgi:hypothetical protein
MSDQRELGIALAQRANAINQERLKVEVMLYGDTSGREGCIDSAPEKAINKIQEALTLLEQVDKLLVDAGFTLLRE